MKYEWWNMIRFSANDVRGGKKIRIKTLEDKRKIWRMMKGKKTLTKLWDVFILSGKFYLLHTHIDFFSIFMCTDRQTDRDRQKLDLWY